MPLNLICSLRLRCINIILLVQGSSFKSCLIVFLFSDWLKSNHLRSRIECGFLDMFLVIFVVL